MHSWTIREDDTVIAELYADLATGQIMNVWTKETRRGEGPARKVHEAAEATVELSTPQTSTAPQKVSHSRRPRVARPSKTLTHTTRRA